MSKMKIPLSGGPKKKYQRPTVKNVNFTRQEDLDAYYLNKNNKDPLYWYLIMLMLFIAGIIGIVVFIVR